jgi:hypothetical protein
MALLTASCGTSGSDSQETATPYTPRQIAEAMISAIGDKPPLSPLIMGDDFFLDYFSNIYLLDADILEDGAVFYANGAFATEIAVLQLTGNADVPEAERLLRQYIEARADAFSGYAPGEAAMLNHSAVASHGRYVALLICTDPQTAKAVFLACFSANPPSLPDMAESQAPDADPAAPENGNGSDAGGLTGSQGIGDTGGLTGGQGIGDADNPAEATPGSAPVGEGTGAPGSPNQLDDPTESGAGSNTESGSDPGDSQQAASDAYDHDAVLSAWRSGDSSSLSEKNRSILDACAGVIAEIIKESMSGYEKELALHDWIISHADYDQAALSNAPGIKPDPDNDNPYGLLFHKKAICSGYTSTFQLFMDMTGVECITVNGSSGGEEHAWNLVRLEGKWYCVDVTWDDPVLTWQTSSVKHKFFNVTSEYMRDNKHQWDESTAPEAVN